MQLADITDITDITDSEVLHRSVVPSSRQVLLVVPPGLSLLASSCLPSVQPGQTERVAGGGGRGDVVEAEVVLVHALQHSRVPAVPGISLSQSSSPSSSLPSLLLHSQTTTSLDWGGHAGNTWREILFSCQLRQ